MKKILILLLSLLAQNIYSQSIDVTEIELNFEGSASPKNITKGNTKMYFTIDIGINGKAIWAYDMTTNTTYQVKYFGDNSNSYFDSSVFLTVDDILYFTVYNGTQLWKTDGTELGTVLIKQIFSNSWNPISKLFNYNNKIIFGAYDDINGQELWTSDGTIAGTTLLKDIKAGANSSSPSSFFAFNGSFFFTAEDGINGREIWISDGTTAGTSLLKNINSTSSNSIWGENFIVLNNAFYFYATNNINGFELWKSDGTLAGTQLFKDITVGSGSSNQTLIGAGASNYFIFEVNSSSIGTELWKCDGTQAGTTLLKDINPGSNYSVNEYTQFAVLNNKIYFNAETNANGNELWETNGTTVGTQLVKDIYVGSSGSNINGLTATNGHLIFSAKDNTYTYNTLWKSDGTTTGTFELKNVNLTESLFSNIKFIEFNNRIFFPAGNNTLNGIELWTTDGTTQNTSLFKDLSHRNDGMTDFYDSAELGGKLIFTGNNGNAKEPFITDGTINGSHIIKDINPGNVSPFFTSSDFRPASYTKAGNYVFFRAASSGYGNEIWKTDGTEANTSMVKDIKIGNGSSISEFPLFMEFNNIFYFKADDGIHGEELWRSDGTEAGTYMVKDINLGSAFSMDGISNIFQNHPYIINEKCYAVLNGFLYFSAYDGVDFSIWRTDGTEIGTVKVVTIPQSNNPNNGRIIINATNNKFFFKTNSNLWSSDGTQLGTTSLYQFTVEGVSENIIHNNNLYFTVFTPNGNTLMKSDGTVSGTVVVKDNFTTQETFNALTSCGDNVYFAVGSEGLVSSEELWRTDGTTSGTIKLGDLSSSSNEGFLYCNTCHQSNLIFKKDFNDNKIYYVNANSTNADSFLTPNILNSENFGENGYYSFTNFYNFNNKLLFAGSKQYGGYELYSSEFNFPLLNSTDFENNATNNIRIYPNPAKDIINFQTFIDENIINADIYDLMGKKIFTSEVINNKLQLSNIENGIYIINIHTNKSNYTAKIIIQK